VTATGSPLEGIDVVMQASTVAGGSSFPGAVVVVERRGEIAYRHASGFAQTHTEAGPLPEPRAVDAATVFDVASLTKVCAAAPIFMQLVATGTLDLDARVGTLLPAFAGAGKDVVTVRDLLTHRAGLWEWWPLYCDASTRAEAIEVAARLDLRYAPRAERHYSDIGLILAGAIAEKLTGSRIDELAGSSVFGPLRMRDSRYVPPHAARERIAATSTADRYERHMLATGDPYPTGRDPDDFDSWRSHTLVGEVEDGNAHHAFGGVAAHAGLFSTADDVVRLGRALLESVAGTRAWLAPEVARMFLADPDDDGEPSALVFWSDRRADLGLGHGGFGHSGFTGTQVFIEPATDLVVVMLTNRTHHAAPTFPYPSVVPVWTEVLRCATEWVNA